MSPPYLPLYVADYMADTPHLTTEQHGAYLLLLLAMWRHGGSVANDDAQLARITKMPVRRWREKVGPVVRELLAVRDDGRLTQKRLAKELQKASDLSQKRGEAGSRGGKAKSLKSPELPLAFARNNPGNCYQRARLTNPESEEETLEVQDSPSEGDQDFSQKGLVGWCQSPEPPADQSLDVGELDELAYSDAEIADLTLKFDLLDLSAELPSLKEWAAAKIRPGKRKSKIWKALQRKNAERKEALEIRNGQTGPPKVEPSQSLLNSRLTKRRA